MNYHRHGSFFSSLLESKQTLLRVFEKGERGAEEIAQSFIYRSVSIIFNNHHHKNKDEKDEKEELHRFMSLDFWEEEEIATKVMEELLARTNYYVSASLARLSVRI